MPQPRRSSSFRWFLGALLFAGLYWCLDLAVLKGGVPHPLDDNWEDNLIAEHLLSGEGFRTRMIYPPLWGMRDAESQTVPVLIHGPLLPILTTIPLRLSGPGALDRVAWAGGLVAFLAVIPLYRLAHRHFGPAVGAAAAVIWTIAPLTLEAVHHSLSVILGAFLLVTALDLLMRERPRTAAAGIVTGLAYLVRPEMLLAAPVLAFLAWRNASRTGQPWRAHFGQAAMFGLGFALCASWWWWHHWRVTGSPFFNLSAYTLIGYWGDRPGASVLQDFDLPPGRWPEAWRAAWPTLWHKWVAFFPHAVKHALFTPSGGTGWLAVIGLLSALVFHGEAAERDPDRPELERSSRAQVESERRTRRLALAAFVLASIPIVSMTLTIYQRFYLVPFSTLFAIGAAWGARQTIRRLPVWAHRPRAWIGALVLLMLPSTLPALRESQQNARLLERRLAGERAALAFMTERRDDSGGRSRKGWSAGPPRPIFSDTPDFVAWTTGRPTFWFTRDEFVRLYERERGAAARRLGLPPLTEADGWFHDDPSDPRSVGWRSRERR